MKRFRRGSALIVLTSALVLTGRAIATANTGPMWSNDQLVDFSQVVVTGRVSGMASGWDPSVGSIYTYVTIDVDQVLKGAVSGSRIVLKQGGGIVGEIGVEVSGQAEFALGEDVLVFAEVRPRDQTLYTTALWQGKWSIETDEDGARHAVLRDPHARGGAMEIRREPLDAMLQLVGAQAARVASAEAFDALPVDAPVGDLRSPFVLLNTKWLATPVSVDIVAGGQPNLGGNGFAQLQNIIGQWNAALAGGFAYQTRSITAASRCADPFANSGVLTITANDPCAEVSNSGGTLAVATTWFTVAVQQVFNGIGFRRILEVIITTNDSAAAQQFVTNANCYQQVLLHEVGHSLGLDHTPDASAVMFATVAFSQCSAGARALQPDDIAGGRMIYIVSGGGTPPASAPTGLAVTVNGTASITVTFNAVADATGYRLDFRQTIGGPVLATVPTGSTSTTVPLPPGIAGAFNVTATATNSAGAGPTSAPVQFTIGSGPGPCTAPPGAPSNLTFSFSGLVVTLNWTGGAGATEHIVQAGSVPGSANIFNGSVGPATSISAAVPAGFTAFVQVLARNACGTSGPSNIVQITAGGAPPPPSPGGLNGVWNGTTSQNYPITFTVENNVLTRVQFTATASGGGCSITTTVTTTGSLAAIPGNTVSYSNPGAPGSASYNFAGTFASANSASGSVSFTTVPIPGVPGQCVGTGTFSWTATK